MKKLGLLLTGLLAVSLLILSCGDEKTPMSSVESTTGIPSEVDQGENIDVVQFPPGESPTGPVLEAPLLSYAAKIAAGPLNIAYIAFLADSQAVEGQ